MQTAPVSERTLEAADWRAVSTGGATAGAPDAPVILVEFYDYECPFCRQIQQNLDALLKKYPRDITLIHRHLPLEIHSAAYPAAIAAECAKAQGWFKVYHEALFKHQAQLAEDFDWVGTAQLIGMPDLFRFEKCLEQVTPSGRVDDDMRLAGSIGIRSIPTVIVNGNVFTGVLDANELEGIIKQALRELKSAS